MTAPIADRSKLLEYFRKHSVNSDPGRHAPRYDDLPTELGPLCEALQGLILHMFWIGENTYGTTHQELKASGRKLCEEFVLSTAEERLDSILALDDSPLSTLRAVEMRSVGCCRDYALMLCSVLRHRGVPARVRTGIALHFQTEDGHLYEDHYVTEHWNEQEQRWQLTDPQIDAVQRPFITKDLDTMDLPADVFLTGWQLLEGVRHGTVPSSVGFPPVNTGTTYARNKLFADFTSVTGTELPVHAWWGLGEPKSVVPGDDELTDGLVDLLQRIDQNDVEALNEALALAVEHPRLAMPSGFVVPPYSAPFC